MPRAYWLGFEDRTLSSQLVLLQSSIYEFDRIMNATSNAGNDDYDMDITMIWTFCISYTKILH